MWLLEPNGVSDLATSVCRNGKIQKRFFKYSSGVASSVKNRYHVHVVLILGKIYISDLDTIYINPQRPFSHK